MSWNPKAKVNRVLALAGLLAAVAGLQGTAQAGDVRGVEKKALIEALSGPGAPTVMQDKEVAKWFKINAAAAKVGASTNWVDVTKMDEPPHSLWLVKTGPNRWEMRGAM